MTEVGTAKSGNQYSGIGKVRLLERVVDRCGLARAEAAGDNGDRMRSSTAVLTNPGARRAAVMVVPNGARGFGHWGPADLSAQISME